MEKVRDAAVAAMGGKSKDGTGASRHEGKSLRAVAEYLQTVTFFAKLDAPTLKACAMCCRYNLVAPGQSVMQAGAVATT